ncbi:transporter [Billgrantia sp. LNSP4103-1]|uniref:transporter n=1 Tax=Billgrantia sp. LNSP4103-1 TaxID=3410266 RepID=UPI00403F0909
MPHHRNYMPGGLAFTLGLAMASFVSGAWAQVAGAQPQQGQPQQNEPSREAQPSQSVRDVLREEHTLFSDRLTIEPGVTYTYSDRNQLALSGFLVLDAIFLGNISVDSVKDHTTTFDLDFRYGLTDRMELELSLPYVYRSSTYETVGKGGAGDESIDADVSDSGIGDVRASLYYRLLPETEQRPDVVWNFGVRAPTGKHPYGIDTRTVEDSEGNLADVPLELPTGNGVWGVSTGFSVLKTLDPAIVFANMSYMHNFEESFDDISSDPGQSPGKIDIGDSIRFGFGTAFALNPRFSLSLSYSHQHAFESTVSEEGQGKRSLVGSSATSGSVNLGATYAMSERTSLVSNVGIGLTDDAPDITITFSLPFQM